MAVQWSRLGLTPSPVVCDPNAVHPKRTHLPLLANTRSRYSPKLKRRLQVVSALDPNDNSGRGGGSVNNHDFASDNSLNNSGRSNRKGSPSTPSSNYVVPLDKSSCITRPLAEILRDLNKRIPDNIIQMDHHDSPHSPFIPWYHANRMLSFYAPGWCGEIRDIIFSDNSSVTVVYRVTIRGSDGEGWDGLHTCITDGEAHRESTGTVSVSCGSEHIVDPVAAAEEMAFCRACARFGLGLYLYHD